MVATNNIISKLPVEAIQDIFMLLSSEGLGKVRKCCKTWRRLASTEYFCKSKLNFNWRNDIFGSSILHLSGCIECLIHLDDKILIAGMDFDKILIIDISNGKIKQSISAKGWRNVKKSEDKLYAVCSTHMNPGVRWKVWSLQSYELICNIHTDTEILDLNYHYSTYKHLIAYISYKNYYTGHVLHIFNIETGKLNYKKIGITAVRCYNDIIAMASTTGIEIRDLNYNPLMILNFEENGEVVNKIEMKNDYIVTISRYRRVCVWNLKTKVKLYTIEQAYFPILKNFLNENILCCTKGESFVLVDLLTGKIIREMTVHKRYSILSNNRFIFMENMDTERTEVWCPRTQTLIKSFNLRKLHTSKYGLDERRIGLWSLVSNTNFAYFNKFSPHFVHVMNFGKYISSLPCNNKCAK